MDFITDYRVSKGLYYYYYLFFLLVLILSCVDYELITYIYFNLFLSNKLSIRSFYFWHLIPKHNLKL